MREMFVGEDDEQPPEYPKQTEYVLDSAAGIDWWAVFEETRGKTLSVMIRPAPQHCHAGNNTKH